MRGGYRENAGRKKGFSALEAEKARDLISRKLSENLEPIINKLILNAKKGDLRTIRELFDRAYGRPAQTSVFESDSSIPLSITFDNSFNKELSEEHKAKLLSLIND